MKEKIITILAYIIRWYNGIWNSIHFKRMCKRADKLANRTGRYHHVVAAGGKLQVINRDDVKAYNRKYKNDKVMWSDVDKQAYYTAEGKGRKRNVVKNK